MAQSSKIAVNGDEFLTKHNEWAKGKASDASNSGTRRQAIGAYAEKAGLEPKAMSQVRAGLKIKNDGKRKDWLRSMQNLLPIAEREIFDNEPEMEIENPNEDEMKAAAASAMADQSNEMAEDHGVGDDAESGDSEIDDDTADFEDHADSVEDDTVVPFGEDEPVDFGGEADDAEVAAE